MRRVLLPVMLVVLLSLVVPLGAQDDTEANKALVARYTEEVFNEGNIDLMAEFFTEDALIHDSHYGRIFLHTFANAISSFHTPTLEEAMLDNGKVGATEQKTGPSPATIQPWQTELSQESIHNDSGLSGRGCPACTAGWSLNV